MRVWIYNRIKSLALPAGMGDRVLSSGSDQDNPIKPFLIVSMGIEQKPLGTTAEMRVVRLPFTVWVHDEPGSMLHIDDGARVLETGLPTPDGQRVGNASFYNIEWEETGADAFDDHFGTNTRPVRFVMVMRRAG